MAWQTKAVLNALVTMVQGLSTMQGTVNKGVPESFPTLVSGYVAAGLPEVRRGTSGRREMDSRFFVGFGYAIEGAEQDAEDKLCDTVDAFCRAFESSPFLGGLLEQPRMVDPGAATPEYAIVVGQEFRHVQFLIMGVQVENVPV